MIPVMLYSVMFQNKVFIFYMFSLLYKPFIFTMIKNKKKEIHLSLFSKRSRGFPIFILHP